MFHFLSCFNLKESTSVEEFESSLRALHAHLHEIDLLQETGPIGRRVRHPVMDTDEERDYEYYFVMSFRDRAQCDASVEYIQAHKEPGLGIHDAVNNKIADAVFICWEDV